MTVKTTGTLSLNADVLPTLPAGATADGTENIGDNPVSMSQFLVGGSLPASGTISFSDFYGIDNSYTTTIAKNTTRATSTSYTTQYRTAVTTIEGYGDGQYYLTLYPFTSHTTSHNTTTSFNTTTTRATYVIGGRTTTGQIATLYQHYATYVGG